MGIILFLFLDNQFIVILQFDLNVLALVWWWTINVKYQLISSSHIIDHTLEESFCFFSFKEVWIWNNPIGIVIIQLIIFIFKCNWTGVTAERMVAFNHKCSRQVFNHNFYSLYCQNIFWNMNCQRQSERSFDLSLVSFLNWIRISYLLSFSSYNCPTIRFLYVT